MDNSTEEVLNCIYNFKNSLSMMISTCSPDVFDKLSFSRWAVNELLTDIESYENIDVDTIRDIIRSRIIFYGRYYNNDMSHLRFKYAADGLTILYKQINLYLGLYSKE